MSQAERELQIAESEGVDLPTYRPVSAVGVVGLLFGLLAAVALFHPVMWVVPLVAAAINVYALWSIDPASPTIGRSVAAWGLVLALFFLACAPARVLCYEYLERRDARQFGGQWFELLQQGKPEAAYQMTLLPGDRTLDAGRLEYVYRGSQKHREGLQQYLQTPVVKTLLALGDESQVRYYSTERAVTDGRHDAVDDVYAVTYEELGKKKSFFVRLVMWRNLPKDDEVSGWRIQTSEGGVRPRDWPAATPVR